MNNSQIKMKILFEKSNSLQIPYENLIAGCAIETIIELLFAKGKKTGLELCNGKEFSIAGYQKKCFDRMELRVKPNAEADLRQILENCFENSCVSLDREAGKKEGKFSALVQIDQIQVSIQLLITAKRNEKENKQIRAIPSILDNQKKISFDEYLIEAEIAECLETIAYYMDLIPEIEAYYRLYEIIHSEMVEGRKIVELIQKGSQAKLFTPERKEELFAQEFCGERFEKWNLFMKKMKIEEPDFEQLFRTCKNFAMPLWDAVSKNELFFGDWMPELERFL